MKKSGNTETIIKTICSIKGCGKSFLIDSAESKRHFWEYYHLDEDDHYELNKDPSPVKDMEELVHR
jgi:hypothetical protein